MLSILHILGSKFLQVDFRGSPWERIPLSCVVGSLRIAAAARSTMSCTGAPVPHPSFQRQHCCLHRVGVDRSGNKYKWPLPGRVCILYPGSSPMPMFPTPTTPPNVHENRPTGEQDKSPSPDLVPRLLPSAHLQLLVIGSADDIVPLKLEWMDPGTSTRQITVARSRIWAPPPCPS